MLSTESATEERNKPFINFEADTLAGQRDGIKDFEDRTAKSDVQTQHENTTERSSEENQEESINDYLEKERGEEEQKRELHQEPQANYEEKNTIPVDITPEVQAGEPSYTLDSAAFFIQEQNEENQVVAMEYSIDETVKESPPNPLTSKQFTVEKLVAEAKQTSELQQYETAETMKFGLSGQNGGSSAPVISLCKEDSFKSEEISVSMGSPASSARLTESSYFKQSDSSQPQSQLIEQTENPQPSLHTTSQYQTQPTQQSVLQQKQSNEIAQTQSEGNIYFDSGEARVPRFDLAYSIILIRTNPENDSQFNVLYRCEQ